jgi:trehalose 6-phosphate phosphatase
MGGDFSVSTSRFILSPDYQPMLAAFAQRRVLVALDFDGVLAPLAPLPELASVPVQTRRLANRVATLYPAVVISGRWRSQLVDRLPDVPFARLIGNFGYQPRDHAGHPEVKALVRRWAAVLTESCGDHGITIEDKLFSLAVHYRHARNRAEARARILKAVQTLEGARWLNGTLAISVLPASGMHKGTALQSARKSLGCDCAIYVGDDDTDEDAFASDSPERLIAIRVGRAAHSSAPYRLHHQADIDAFLRVLIGLRAPGSRPQA